MIVTLSGKTNNCNSESEYSVENISSPTVPFSSTSVVINFQGITKINGIEVKRENLQSSVTFEPNDGYIHSEDDYLTLGELVDLGLPSGLKWASCNLGAKTPEDFGIIGYFGDTVGGIMTSDSIQRKKITGVFKWNDCDVNYTITQKAPREVREESGSYAYRSATYNLEYKGLFNRDVNLQVYIDEGILTMEEGYKYLHLTCDYDMIYVHNHNGLDQSNICGERLPTAEECQELLENTTPELIGNCLKFVSKNNNKSIIFPLSYEGETSYNYNRPLPSMSATLIGLSSSIDQTRIMNLDHVSMMMRYYNNARYLTSVDIRYGCTFRGVSK